MQQITIALRDELYAELVQAAAATRERAFGPEHWAEEAVEAALATRRLPRFARPCSTPRTHSENVQEYRALCAIPAANIEVDYLPSNE